MRNGVLAVTRDGTVVEMNAEAFRIFQLKRTAKAVGRPFTEVLAKHPDIIRVLHSAFELSHLPNRAELRLRSTGKVIGYTLSHVRDERGRDEGVVLFSRTSPKSSRWKSASGFATAWWRSARWRRRLRTK